MKKLIVSAIVILGFSAISFGQNSDFKTAIASGTIITPLHMGSVTNMQFGNIVANAAGNVVLASDGSTPVHYDAGVPAYIVNNGNPTHAIFDVSGQGGYAFNVTLSNLPTVVTHKTDATTTMSISDFTSNVTGTTLTGTANLSGSATGQSGTYQVFVGATLHVGTGQKAGLYESTPFQVAVNYN